MQKHSFVFDALGTVWRIETAKPLSSQFKQKIVDRIEMFDATYSRFRKDSLVTRISKQAGSYTFPEDANKLFSFYREIYDATSGQVTPLIGDMLSRAGYDANYSLEPQALQSLPEWHDAMQWREPVLQTYQPVLLDFGAAGKGYLVDIVSSILDEHAIDEYVIDASGDIRHKGTSENKVGLEHPYDAKKVIGVVDVQNKSLCASASNRRAWGEGMHHIFDPSAMTPVREVVATWVVADNTMLADGLATALFFTNPGELLETFQLEYARVFSGGEVQYSALFEGKLF